MEVSTKLFQYDLCNYFFRNRNQSGVDDATWHIYKKRIKYVTEEDLRNVSAYLFMLVDLMNDP